MKKWILLILLVVAFMMLPRNEVPAVQAAGRCKDIPLRWTLYNSVVTDSTTGATIPSTLQSDGGGEYTSAQVTVCAGTNDAVVNLSSTNRTFAFAFPSPIPGSVVEAVPAWVPGRYPVSGWINVRNIMFSKQPFTTYMGSTFTRPGDKTPYRLGWDPFQVDAPDLHSGSTLASVDNTPYPTSPAMVYPNYPAVCGTGNMPSWTVIGATPNSLGPMQVAALHKVPFKPNDPATHEGQYTLPFEMFIQTTQCFPY